MTVTLQTGEAIHIALKLHKAGATDEAELLYRRVLEEEPHNLNALHFLAVLCHQDSRNDEALELIRQIITLAPGNADAHNNLGNVLEGLGRFPEAEEYYRKALELKPDHAPALNNLGVMLMSQNRIDEAVGTYHQAVKLAPDAPDFRYNLGNALRKSEKFDEAIEVYREALKLNQNHEGAWRGLARTYLLAGRKQDAADAFDQWLRLDPGNELAQYMRAACLGKDAPERAPEAYLCTVFDGFANRFDAHLVDNLSYRAPNLLAEALGAALPSPASQLDILDAGCGTGLCGPLLKPYARRLTGVDLSKGMLAVAKTRETYDELVAGELTEFLEAAEHRFDIVASSDTLCYFGPLEHVFEASARALKPGGLLSFTLEDAGDEAPPWRLDSTARYSHRRSYVTDALASAGFAVYSLDSAVLRTEGGQPVNGHVVVARKAIA